MAIYTNRRAPKAPIDISRVFIRVGIAAENPQRPERKRKARGFAANSPTICQCNLSFKAQNFMRMGPAKKQKNKKIR
jgi:hypothetical protein